MVAPVERWDYTPEEQSRGQRYMILEGVFSRGMEGVTSGLILVAFALTLGASDAMIGLLAAIPFLVQLAHLPAVALLTRFPDPRRIAVAAGLAARTVFFLLALLPLLALPLSPLLVLVPLVIAHATVATFGAAAWQVWVRGLVPRERLGAYFGRRMGILSAVGLIVLLAAGRFIPWWEIRFPDRALAGFAVLFALGGALGYASSLLMARAPGVRLPPRQPERFADTLRRPFQDANYRRLLLFLGSWGFAANFALPFITVVLLTRFGYDLGVVTLMAAVSLVANMAGFPLWARFTDRFGNKPILGLSATLFVLTMLAWTVLPKTPGTLTLAGVAAIHALLGWATSGLDLASNGVIMKLAPNEDVPAYLSSASLVRAVTTGVAPLLAGLAATLLAGHEFTLRITWTYPGGETAVTALRFLHHDFLFLASALVGLYSVHRLLGFREEGEAPPQEVLRAMRREVTQVSSVAGLRQFAHTASYVALAAFRFERRRNASGRRPPREPQPPEAREPQ